MTRQQYDTYRQRKIIIENRIAQLNEEIKKTYTNTDNSARNIFSVIFLPLIGLLCLIICFIVGDIWYIGIILAVAFGIITTSRVRNLPYFTQKKRNILYDELRPLQNELYEIDVAINNYLNR